MDTQIEVEGRRKGWERKWADIRSGILMAGHGIIPDSRFDTWVDG